MRHKLLVDRMALKKVIDEVEINGPLENRQLLAIAVAETDWAKNYKPKPITSSVVLLRIEEFHIEPKTPKGRRGKRAGFVLTEDQKKKMQEGRRYRKNFDMSELSVPDSQEGLLLKVASGSLTAAIKLKCLQCCNYYREEIKHCSVKSCSLWNFRPYKEK